ncbi:MAG: universal stress protein [Gammaproteobacteria bacterium]|nr:universal stress protein [Gammaproteobacteria bacterium]
MRRILVAIDGSDCALRALDFAVQQARCAPKAELHVLNIQLPANAYTAWEIYVTAERIQQIATERARAILEAAAARLKKADCSYKLEQLEGDPATTIAGRAAELACESITMGTRGSGPLGILVMGSVAQKVIYHATLPVTLVK